MGEESGQKPSKMRRHTVAMSREKPPVGTPQRRLSEVQSGLVTSLAVPPRRYSTVIIEPTELTM